MISRATECYNMNYDKKPTKILEKIFVENACDGSQVSRESSKQR